MLHIREMKVSWQKFSGSLRAEEQYREGKNKVSTSVETLLLLTFPPQKAKDIKNGMKR